MWESLVLTGTFMLMKITIAGDLELISLKEVY